MNRTNRFQRSFKVPRLVASLKNRCSGSTPITNPATRQTSPPIIKFFTKSVPNCPLIRIRWCKKVVHLPQASLAIGHIDYRLSGLWLQRWKREFFCIARFNLPQCCNLNVRIARVAQRRRLMRRTAAMGRLFRATLGADSGRSLQAERTAAKQTKLQFKALPLLSIYGPRQQSPNVPLRSD